MTEYQLLIIEGMIKLENDEWMLKLVGEILMRLCKYSVSQSIFPQITY